jgi:hypothetical protein
MTKKNSVTVHGVEYAANHGALPENRAKRMAVYQSEGFGLSEINGWWTADHLPEGPQRSAVEEWANTVLEAEMAKPYEDRTAVYFDFTIPFPHTGFGQVPRLQKKKGIVK